MESEVRKVSSLLVLLVKYDSRIQAATICKFSKTKDNVSKVSLDEK